MFFKGFIPHFLEFGFKFVACSVIYSSDVWCVSSLKIDLALLFSATSLLI